MKTPTKKVIVRQLEILALSAILTACASGGGSQPTSGVNPTPTQPPSTSTPTPAPTPAPSPEPAPTPEPEPTQDDPQVTQAHAFPTPTANELNASFNAKNSGALAAFNEGITGKGVKVGVLDSGLSAAVVSDLGLGSLTPKQYNAKQAKTTEYEDLLGHGSMVSSIISQAIDGKNGVGSAPNATLYMVNTLADNNQTFSLNAISKGMDYLIENKINVTNMSFACDATDAATDACPSAAKAILSKASTANMMVVLAAGNDGAANPQYPARFAKEAEAQGQFLVVGSVDANNVMSSFSSRAGDTKDFYMVAQGEDVTVLDQHGTPVIRSGTSLAAPLVTGAAALIMEKWPQVSAAQVVQILLTSAKDLGATGVDDVYGHGLLDIAAAMQPSGNLTVPASNGTSVPAATVSAPAAYASPVLLAIQTGKLKLIALDRYGRDFSLASVVTTTKSAADLAQVSSPLATQVYESKNEQGYARSAWQAQADGSNTQAYGSKIGALSFQAGDLAMRQMVNAPESHQGFNMIESDLSSQILSSGSQFLGSAYQVGDATFGVHFAGDSSFKQQLAGLNISGKLSNQSSYRIDLSLLNEESGLLGGDAGFLGFGSSTYLTELGWNYRFTPDLQFDAMFGLANSTLSSGSFNSSNDTILSNTWKLGFTQNNVFDRRQAKLGFGIQQPLSVMNGNMSFLLPTSVNPTNNQTNFSRQTVDLATGPKEIRYESFYSQPSGSGTVFVRYALRQNPDNTNAPSISSFGVSYVQPF